MQKNALAYITLIVTVGIFGLIVADRAGASFPVTLTDDIGRTVTITSPPQRIVCITPSTTEIAYALGLGNKIVGVDVYSDYPLEAVSKQRISNIYTPNPEEVAALNPDLVLMYSFWGQGDPYVDAIAGLGVNVIAIKPRSLNDIINNIRLIGRATGKIEEAETLASQLNSTINQIRNRTGNLADKPRVYIEFWYPPPWTFGPNTWGDEIIRVAGGVNVFGDALKDYVQTTDEEVISRNPEIIISLYGAQHVHFATLEEIRKRPGWTSIKAVQDGKVYLLDENLLTRPGPRIVLGLEAVARLLHPELFGESNILALNTTILRTSTQTLSVSGLVKADVTVFKAAGNGTLIVTATTDGPPPPTGLTLVGKYLKIECSTPEGLVFALKIRYSESELANLRVDEDTLKIYYWDKKTGKWLPLISLVNSDANYVEAFVPHLSSFALMGESLPSVWQSPVELWLVLVTVIVITLVTISLTYSVCKKRLKKDTAK
ncbi:MAG: cobalamin-binding protein [Candidatus Bathyarchaeota archaeon]|nr:cobalamin-binding protein [Candidatus Bathyarchaeota archaeon]